MTNQVWSLLQLVWMMLLSFGAGFLILFSISRQPRKQSTLPRPLPLPGSDAAETFRRMQRHQKLAPTGKFEVEQQ